VQATLLPAFSYSCKTENRKHQNRNLVFLLAKVIQACSLLNPDGDKNLIFLDNRSRTRISAETTLRQNLGLALKLTKSLFWMKGE